ncbi:alpha/beta-hydrolase [Guyanagaster necrorhizus]|uniref:Alpha/beta-hydrolase n=1 Tax=Guyanagaster necrorhizus TaxID=856835 RepID=A0A9P7W3B2_9AGAR|nr:alpha/beta-hydrolase [Guyanagaster necrorhizus MCA 3950]KAG7451319.1 alpha/beta-hydrolase [Guyanagaster necrorhizus MCA 3950]
MTGITTKVKYGQVSWGEILDMARVLAPLPFLLCWKLLTSPFVKHLQHKTWLRVISDCSAHQLTSLGFAQLQYALGDSVTVYNNFISQARLMPLIEELDGGVQLAWVGPKRTDRVVLYLHGTFIYFCKAKTDQFACQLELEKKGLEAGLAVLLYSLLPDAGHPTPLREMRTAVDYLIKSGVAPNNLIFTSDSAGGNLTLAFFSHILHPHPTIEPFSLPADTRFGGAFLLSPWVSLAGDDVPNSYDENGPVDVTDAATLRAWGHYALEGVPLTEINYMEPIKTPDGWYEGTDQLVDNVFISVGEFECLRDSILTFYEKKFKRYAGRSQLYVQKGGVHVDPFYDFFFAASPKTTGKLTPEVVTWIADSFKIE